MKFFTVILGFFIALAAAIPATDTNNNRLVPKDDISKALTSECSSTIIPSPTANTTLTTSTTSSTSAHSSTDNPRPCDKRCEKYRCCWPWGECYCNAEVLDEFERAEAAQASLPKPSPVAAVTAVADIPPTSQVCSRRCKRHGCCNFTTGRCNCLSETLDALDRAEAAGTSLTIEEAERSVNVSAVDFGSEANKEWVCPFPCGLVGHKCCWVARMCVCYPGLFPALDRQNGMSMRQ